MHVDELRKAWERRPFRPFAIRMADGTAVTVRHPENLAWDEETRSAACMAGAGRGTAILDLDLITSLDLDPGPAKVKKGRKG